MAKIVQVGGGMCGLLTAVLLAKSGHEVLVLERDAMPPPDDPETAWEQWERRGVNQFRLLHYLQPRFREVAEREMPELITELDRVGASRYNIVLEMPADVRGDERSDDGRFVALTGRRPVIEAAVCAVADATPGLTVRRGVAVDGLLTGPSTSAGYPHVTGVRTDAGEEITADLVVDAMGRRSRLPAWLDAIGASGVIEEEDDCGFVYYGRHFRGSNGGFPELTGGLLTQAGTISTLTLPADNGTWGIGVVASARDADMRALKDPDRWTKVVASMPVAARWLEGEPMGDGIDVMARIPDRHRTFVIDGEPVATGVVAVADAWACTNPSVGRGITIGLLHSVALRDTLAAHGLDDPVATSLAFHDESMAVAEPWYRATLAFDRERLTQIHTLLDGREYVSDDPQYPIILALVVGSQRDPDIARAFASIGSMLSTPEELFSDAAMFEKVIGFAGAEPPPDRFPSREELLSLVG